MNSLEVLFHDFLWKLLHKDFSLQSERQVADEPDTVNLVETLFDKKTQNEHPVVVLDYLVEDHFRFLVPVFCYPVNHFGMHRESTLSYVLRRDVGLEISEAQRESSSPLLSYEQTLFHQKRCFHSLSRSRRVKKS